MTLRLLTCDECIDPQSRMIDHGQAVWIPSATPRLPWTPVRGIQVVLPLVRSSATRARSPGTTALDLRRCWLLDTPVCRRSHVSAAQPPISVSRRLVSCGTRVTGLLIGIARGIARPLRLLGEPHAVTRGRAVDARIITRADNVRPAGRRCTRRGQALATASARSAVRLGRTGRHPDPRVSQFLLIMCRRRLRRRGRPGFLAGWPTQGVGCEIWRR